MSDGWIEFSQEIGFWYLMETTESALAEQVERCE
jgi:hypothetical protein